MKSKLAAITMLLLSGNSWAATSFDGIWTCQLQPKSSSAIYQYYFSIHSRPDGQAIFAVLTESTNADYFKYGIGSITGNTYAGYTKYAMPFALTLGQDGLLTGTMQGNTGASQEFNTKCVKVW